MLARWLNSLRVANNHNIGNNVYSRIFVQTRDYAARKGTREKAKQKKIKRAIEKIGFVPPEQFKKQKVKAKVSPLSLIDDSQKKPTTDDVYVMKFHPQPIYSLKEAIEFHRETHHPTMFNEPNADVNAFIELNMKFAKRNKYIDQFSNVVETPHPFKSGDSGFNILALSKDVKQQELAEKAGAKIVGGAEIIKQIQAGRFEFQEYDYIVAHVDILTELLLVRGLLKRKFPNTKVGNLGNDMHKLVMKFKNATRYSAIQDADHKDYGQINVPFGKLNMDTTHLDENLAAIITNVYSVGSKYQESFIARVQVSSLPSTEYFKIDISGYLPKKIEEPVEEPVEEPDDNIILDSH
ncbi:50S ribosomal protein L1 isoform X2 [Osmia bicornis bicornis]|uniref:50S ribosomal protein L1 isoform X2 n=1 Tax=Osmia bicornis bicornis TaxID=1437191 RepID=UPI0010F4950A|nr:50S ribosomal protein L1 isoform X2 [Osmia bicornis bicornis]